MTVPKCWRQPEVAMAPAGKYLMGRAFVGDRTKIAWSHFEMFKEAGKGFEAWNFRPLDPLHPDAVFYGPIPQPPETFAEAFS